MKNMTLFLSILTLSCYSFMHASVQTSTLTKLFVQQTQENDAKSERLPSEEERYAMLARIQKKVHDEERSQRLAPKRSPKYWAADMGVEPLSDSDDDLLNSPTRSTGTASDKEDASSSPTRGESAPVPGMYIPTRNAQKTATRAFRTSSESGMPRPTISKPIAIPGVKIIPDSAITITQGR